MTNVIATNITSPLGLSTEENYLNVRQGRTAISSIDNWNGIPGRTSVGIFGDETRKSLLIDGFTWFESLLIHSIREASGHAAVQFGSERLGLILCTTKGNVECLDGSYETSGVYSAPGESALKIARFLGMVTEPVAVCNACISGVTGQILADRYISSGIYDTVIVCGADTVSRFCLAGFGSFKSLSPYPCRPFDIERLGLNVGECASTVILSKYGSPGKECWQMVAGHLDNDAYHISAPSPDGEGVKRAILNTVPSEMIPEIATVCAHGTATMFNDQMESKAISGAGLSEVPVSAYKGIYGHTLGAAGIIEPVLCMRALSDGVILPITGFDETGVSGKIALSGTERTSDSRTFLKILSGFGGCNGAALYSIGKSDGLCGKEDAETEILKTVSISPCSLSIDGKECRASGRGAALISEIYKTYLDDNTRFYKMDTFSRLAYVAGSLLISEYCSSCEPENISMMFFNRSSSIVADRQHISSFSDGNGFYPSPAVFINTLPNVVMGEIATRYGIKGETTFVILAGKNNGIMDMTVRASIPRRHNSLMICGWVNCDSSDDFEADMKIIHIK